MKRRTKRESSREVGALGVVFGDIGTSPLYALPAVFGLAHFATTRENVTGIISMIIWAITIIVSVKYVLLMMRVDNEGEGGIMALIALVRRKVSDNLSRWVLVGLVGVALFYGDSVITPAISVLSAVEGLRGAVPMIATWVVPIAVVLLTLLFVVQSRGTAKLGTWFGPVMIAWFVISGAVGLQYVMSDPEILWALSPFTALGFIVAHPLGAFVALGAVVLSITGAEALYADMGHFGRVAISRSWFFVVYPALLLNYMGQGALILQQPAAVTNTYFSLFADWAQLPMVLLATLATLIASQAVISGAFSLTSQAIRLGYMPPFRVQHTPGHIGQVYVGVLNWLIYVAVLVLVLTFGSSAHLANAYGMAVSGTLLASTALLMVVASLIWKRLRLVVYGLGAIFVFLETSFVVSSSEKLLYGAWIPLAVAVVVFMAITTWTQGWQIVSRMRHKREKTLEDFVASLVDQNTLVRTPGVAVYLAHHKGNTPLALLETVSRLHELSQTVIIVTVEVANVPRVTVDNRAQINELGNSHDGVVQVVLRYGFDDIPNVPRALERLHTVTAELPVDVSDATYFISESEIELARHPVMSRWRAQLFKVLYRMSAPSPEMFHLPPERTINLASYVEL